MDKENLIEINDLLIKSINRRLENKYQKGLISVLELEKHTKILENIRNNSHIKEKLSMIYKEDLKEYEKEIYSHRCGCNCGSRWKPLVVWRFIGKTQGELCDNYR